MLVYFHVYVEMTEEDPVGRAEEVLLLCQQMGSGSGRCCFKGHTVKSLFGGEFSHAR